MALIKCPECGKKISTHAISCPHCGYVYIPCYDDTYLSKCEVLYSGPTHDAYRKSAAPDVILILLGIFLVPVIIGVFIIIAGIAGLSNRKDVAARNNDALYYDKARKEVIIYSFYKNNRQITTINNIQAIYRQNAKLWIIFMRLDDVVDSVLFGSYNKMCVMALMERLKELSPLHKIIYLDHKPKKKKK